MTSPARTYNQLHIPRPYTSGRRRISMYVSWSYPAEANRDVTVMDNRFSTMTEVRRVTWPAYEGAPFGDPLQFSQGIAGSLELFFRAWEPFQALAGEATGHPVAVFQRVDQAGYRLPLDGRCWTIPIHCSSSAWTIWSPARSRSQPKSRRSRHSAREGTCLVLGPHHDVGASDDLKVRHGKCPSWRSAGAAPAAFRHLYARADQGPGPAGRESLRPEARADTRHQAPCRCP
jgi:hypothetical protein